MLDGFVLLSIGLSLPEADWRLAGLWLAVIASGLYHGVNPGMGWPLAVSAELMGRGFKSARGGTLAANSRPFPGNVRGDLSLRAAGRPCGVAATNSDRRQSLGHRVRHLPGRLVIPQAAPLRADETIE